MKEFTAEEDHAGVRADVFVASQYPQFSRSSLEGLFDQKLVSLNQTPAKPSQKIKSGDKVIVDEALLRFEPEQIEIPVIYEDDNVLVVNKPAGMLTHAKGALNQESSVASFIKPKLSKDFPDNNRAGIVHRLDRATSGVIITAKNPETLKHLQKQFSQRKVKKTYLAIVDGTPDPAEAIIEVPLERNPNRPQTFRAGSGGKPALTQYKVIKSFQKKGNEHSLIELTPQTGRTHQIRVHMAYTGHPVTGDNIYGQPLAYMYLHSKALEITLPGGHRQVFTAAEPKYFKEFMK